MEVQQRGESRAQYGQQVIKKLSDAITEKFGRGFSVDTLENVRKFYQSDRVFFIYLPGIFFAVVLFFN